LGLCEKQWIRLVSQRDHKGIIAEFPLDKTYLLDAVKVAVHSSGSDYTHIGEIQAWGPKTSQVPYDVSGCLEVGFAQPPSATDGSEPLFMREQTPSINVKVLSPLSDSLDLNVALKDSVGSILQEWREDIRSSTGEEMNVTLVPDNLDGGVYCYVVDLLSGKRLLSSESLGFGMENETRESPLDPPLSRGATEGGGLWMIPAWTTSSSGVGNLAFSRAKEANCDALCSVFMLNDIAPHQNCYNFAPIEQTLRRAKKERIGIELLVSMTYHTIPYWLDIPEDRILDCEGRYVPLRSTQGNTPSYWSSLYLQEWQRLVSAIVERFADEDAVRMWHFRVGNADTFYHDDWCAKRIFDYSHHARREFIRYVRDVRGYDLANINERYGTEFESWNDLELPYPDFEAKYDLRPQWADFVDFKQYTIDNLLEVTFSTVREIDPKRPQAFWGVGGSGALDFVIRKCAKYNVLLGFNSIDNPMADIFASLARRQGVSLRAELTARPLRTDRFHRAIFGALKNGAVAYNLSAIPEPEVWEQFIEIEGLFHELCGAKPWSKDVAALFSYTLPRQKSFQWTSWRPLGLIPESIEQLLSIAQTGSIEIDWFSDYSDLSSLHEHKIVIETGSHILPAKAIDALVSYVYSGGTLILFPESGVFERACADSLHPLLERLDWVEQSSNLENVAISRMVLVGPKKSPKVERWHHGNGKIIRFANTFTNTLSVKKCLSEILAEHGIQSPVEVPEGILAAPVEKDGSRYVLLYNTDSATRTVDVRVLNQDRTGSGLDIWRKGKWTSTTAKGANGDYVQIETSIDGKELHALRLN